MQSILYVEDDLNTSDLLSSFLEEYAETVYVANDGESGLRQYYEYSPDLIIADINLPGMSGLEMMRTIRTDNKEIPFIITTAHSDRQYLFDAIDLKSESYLVKPLDLSQLSEKIDACERQLSFRQSKLTNTLALTPELHDNLLFFQLDKHKNIIEVSQRLCNLLRHRHSDLLSQSYEVLFQPELNLSTLASFNETLEYKNSWMGELKLFSTSGNTIWVSVTMTAMTNIEQQVIGYQCIYEDITDFIQARKELLIDPLTKVHNRRAFEENFHELFKACDHPEQKIALVIFDIDHFKQFNDSLGHQVGDIALKQISSQINNLLNRHGHQLYRIGGEEFATMFPETSFFNLQSLMEMILRSLRQRGISFPQSPLDSKFVTISIGAGIANCQNFQDKEALFSKVDKLLYQAKNNGRNQAVVESI